jgi:transposase
MVVECGHQTARYAFGRCVGLPPYSPELQPAEYLWPLTNTCLVNRQFATIEELEDAQFAHCAALQTRPDVIRSTTRFHWWPRQIHTRRGPRRR